MEVVGGNTLLPGDPRLIDHIVCELKSQGIFDQFRKECIADVDTKPAYQNLRQRVEGSVTGFLKTQNWRPDMNKNQLREMLRKNIYESGFLETGVERIVDQVVNPKINTVFLPQVEEVVYKFLGLTKPSRNSTYTPSNGALSINTVDLLPTDLDPISPDSEVLDKSLNKSDKIAEVEEEEEANLDDSKNDEFESPPFEPINEQTVYEAHDETSNDSRISGISGLTSHDSNMSECAEKMNIFAPDVNNQDSQLSKVSSNSRLSIVTTDSKHTPEKMDISDDNTEDSAPKIEQNLSLIVSENSVSVKEETKDELEEIRMEINGHNENKETVVKMEINEDATNNDGKMTIDDTPIAVNQEITTKEEIPEKDMVKEEITALKVENATKEEIKEKTVVKEETVVKVQTVVKVETEKQEIKMEETSKTETKRSDSRHRHDSEKRKDKYSDSNKDRKDDKKSSDKDKKDKYKSSSSSSSRDKDRHREKSRDSKSSKDKDNKSRDDKSKDKNKDDKEKSKDDKEKSKDDKDKSKDDKDKSKSSSTSKHSSRDRNRSSSKSESKTSKDSRDHSKSKDSKSKSDDPKSKKSDSSKSRSRDHSKSDSSKHTSKDRSKSSSSSSKDYRDKKDAKKSSNKREQDDHSSSRDKKTDSRRSADRDSNDGSSGVNNTSTSNSTKEKDSSTSTSSNKSKSDNSDFSGSNSGDSGQSDNFQSAQDSNITPLKVDITLDEVAINSAPQQTNPLQQLKLKKPKIASNIFEVRKLMKIRKKMEKMEKKRQRQQELAEENKNMRSNTESPNSVEDTDSVDSESLLSAPNNIDELMKNMASITGEDISQNEEIPSSTTAIVSKERWDAIEAKLSQSAHENVDFNLYAEDTGDSSSNSKFDESASSRRSKRMSEEEDCLYFSNEVSPTTERFLQSIETFQRNSLLDSSPNVKSKRARKLNNMYNDCEIYSDTSPKKKTIKGKKRKFDGEIDTENNNKKVNEITDVLDNLTSSPSGSNLSNGSIEKLKSRSKKTKKTVNCSPSSDADSENLGETKANKYSRAAMLKSQRYSSDDLYKPRPVVSGTSRRQRGLLNNTDKKN